MPHNPNPFTPYQERFIAALRNKLIEIRDPGKDIDDSRDFEFYLEHTKKLGTIPKIRFRPNTLAIKEEIMNDMGYIPIAKKDHWRARRNNAANAFDSYWNNLIFRLVKAGKLIARFNQMFTEERSEVSTLIQLVQRCITPTDQDETEGKIHQKTDSEPRSQQKSQSNKPNYAEELAKVGQ